MCVCAKHLCCSVVVHVRHSTYVTSQLNCNSIKAQPSDFRNTVLIFRSRVADTTKLIMTMAPNSWQRFRICAAAVSEERKSPFAITQIHPIWFYEVLRRCASILDSMSSRHVSLVRSRTRSTREFVKLKLKIKIRLGACVRSTAINSARRRLDSMQTDLLIKSTMTVRDARISWNE